MCQGYGDASDYPPYHIEDGCKTSARRARGIYVGAEGPEGHARQLEGLEPERYAYDGNHHGGWR